MRAFILFMFLTGVANAAPFLTSDPSTQVPPVTGCAIQLTDTITKAVRKVDTPLVNKGCKYDLAGTLPGIYEAKASFFYVDPVWGRQESVLSAPLELTRPNTPASPAGLGLVQ